MVNAKNRGMLLESIINRSVVFFEEHNLALFHKKFLDIKFSGVDKKTNKIVGAKLTRRSTVDYYGVYIGRFVAFEAKSVKNNSFPLSNIKKHQKHYLQTVSFHKGLSFFIIFFKGVQQFFLVFADDLFAFKQKHLKLEDCEKIGQKIELIYPGFLDFLPLLAKKCGEEVRVC